MLVEILETSPLMDFQKRTGKPVEEIVNDILSIHLDENRKVFFISNQLKQLFSKYKQRHGIDD